MKKFVIACLSLLVATAFAYGQESEGKKKIKIITIDENGKEEVKEFEMGDANVEWETEGEQEMKIIVRSGDGEEEKIVIGNMPKQIRWHMDVMENKAFLGVVMGEDTDDKGLVIKEVTEGSGAEKAGLKAGDIIYEINGESINSSGDLVKQIGKYEVNDAIEVKYMRDGKKKKTNATLGERDNDFYFNMPNMNKEIIIDMDDNDFHYEVKGDPNKAFLGIEPAKKVDGIEGVMILKAVEGSAAEAAGMQTGDVIIAIDGAAISNFDDLKEALSNKKPGDEIKVDYLRMGKKSSSNITLTSHADIMEGHKKVIIEKYEND